MTAKQCNYRLHWSYPSWLCVYGIMLGPSLLYALDDSVWPFTLFQQQMWSLHRQMLTVYCTSDSRKLDTIKYV